jgi:hypothetical protein
MINKVILKVKGGIKMASLVCEDKVNGYVEKVRNFSENETIEIPWSCSIASTPVKFHRLKVSINSDVDIRESIENEAEAALIKFENGETIIHLPAIYAPAIEDFKQAWTSVNYATAGSAAGGSSLFLIAFTASVYCCYKCNRRNKTPSAPRMKIVMTEKEKVLSPEERRMQEFPFHDRVFPQAQIGYAGLQDHSFINPSPDQWMAHIESLRATVFLGDVVEEINPGPPVIPVNMINFSYS